VRDLDGLSKDLGPKPANRAITGFLVALGLLNNNGSNTSAVIASPCEAIQPIRRNVIA